MAAKAKIVAVVIVAAISYTLFSLIASQWLARKNPALASLFRPPLFNLGETYENGEVLEFRIGAMGEETISTAKENGYSVDPACWGDFRAGGEALYSEDEIRNRVEAHNLLCVRKGRSFLLLKMASGRLHSIELRFIRNEAI